MDLLIAPGTVDSSKADTAPATGTPGWATDGDPVKQIARTVFPAYAYNALLAEIYNVIVGAKLTPDRTDNTQLFKAISQIATGSESAFLPLSGGILTGPVTGVAVTDWKTRQLVNALDADARYVAQGITIPSDTSATAAWIDLTTEAEYPRLGIMGKNGTSYGFYGVAKVNQLFSSLSNALLAYFSSASGSSNTTLTNLQGVNWTNAANNSYVQVTGGGVSLAVPTIAYVATSLTDYAQPKGNYQTAGNYIVGSEGGWIIEVFSATVTSSGTINLPRTYSEVLAVVPQQGTDGNGMCGTNIVSNTNSTAQVNVGSYHTGAFQSATITQKFIVIGKP